MQVFTKGAELSAALRKEKVLTGFVPTMGALHQGHASLVERCRRECERVVVSVFVNPTQFNDPSDLQNYPRTLEKDEKLPEDSVKDNQDKIQKLTDKYTGIVDKTVAEKEKEVMTV